MLRSPVSSGALAVSRSNENIGRPVARLRLTYAEYVAKARRRVFPPEIARRVVDADRERLSGAPHRINVGRACMTLYRPSIGILW